MTDQEKARLYLEAPAMPLPNPPHEYGEAAMTTSQRGCDKLIPEHDYEEVWREGRKSRHRCRVCGRVLEVEVVPFGREEDDG